MVVETNNDIQIPKVVFDSAYPLLERLREKAPGTHKHCLNVANICETVALDLGLNKDLLRCAALYHDVGKLTCPTYFSENQAEGQNKHDDLDPYASYLIITRHVTDSVYLLKYEYGDFPDEVIRIITQHHGDTILQAFYNKSTKESPQKFRYQCNKPESTEAAVLMIVDSVEAATKSKYNNTETGNDNNFVKEIINATIEKLVDDGQLDNLKIGILKLVKKVLQKELESTYHKRVSYERNDEKTIKEMKEEDE